MTHSVPSAASRDWDRLRRDALIPGGWKFTPVALGDRLWQLLIPADEDAFLKDSPTMEAWPDPFWTQLWPAARWLAEWTSRRTWPADCRVLELGCGSGLVGLAAAARGCQVTVSDYVPLAVELAVANLHGNGFLNAQGEVLDWRAPQSAPLSDFILAADVIYDPALQEPLLDTIAARLKPGGTCWLANPCRLDAVSLFVRKAADRAWQIKLTDEQGRPVPIDAAGQLVLMELTR